MNTYKGVRSTVLGHKIRNISTGLFEVMCD